MLSLCVYYNLYDLDAFIIKYNKCLHYTSSFCTHFQETVVVLASHYIVHPLLQFYQIEFIALSTTFLLCSFK